MAYVRDHNRERQVPWLPDEHFELALDMRKGMSSSPVAGDNVLTLTTRRAIKLGSESGKRTTSMVPLEKVTAVEVIDPERPTEKLTQGLLVLAIGVLLAITSHVVLNIELITFLVGGLPILAAVYILAGYAFPDTEGELVLHTGAFALRQPLHTPEARRDAYLVAHRIYDMVAGEAPTKSEDSGGVPDEMVAVVEATQGRASPPPPRRDADTLYPPSPPSWRESQGPLREVRATSTEGPEEPRHAHEAYWEPANEQREQRPPQYVPQQPVEPAPRGNQPGDELAGQSARPPEGPGDSRSPVWGRQGDEPEARQGANEPATPPRWGEEAEPWGPPRQAPSHQPEGDTESEEAQREELPPRSERPSEDGADQDEERRRERDDEQARRDER